MGMPVETAARKPGRPRAIPDPLVADVVSLYRQGNGYRAIARELRLLGVSVDWSTVRRVIKNNVAAGAPRNGPQTGSDTILPLGSPAGTTKRLAVEPGAAQNRDADLS